jgi:hypothetical protein
MIQQTIAAYSNRPPLVLCILCALQLEAKHQDTNLAVFWNGKNSFARFGAYQKGTIGLLLCQKLWKNPMEPYKLLILLSLTLNNALDELWCLLRSD